MDSGSLRGRVAVVTGATRGIGKGVALCLGAEGAIVYVTGRTRQQGESQWPGSLDETVSEIGRRGGTGIGVPVDHRDDSQIEALFERVICDHKAVDILVNNVWSRWESPDFFGTPFWRLPNSTWDEMAQVGLRSHLIASMHAARSMTERRRGLIVNVSSSGSKHYLFNVPYGMVKAALDKMTCDMAEDLRPYSVSAISLWPGFVVTEKLRTMVDRGQKLTWDLATAESPEFTGRAVIALANDPEVAVRSGRAFTNASLARDYGFVDVDGNIPEPSGQLFAESGTMR